MIAHEVNNTMAGVGSILDTLQELSNEEEKELMAVCVDRCHSMSRFITRFADVVKIPEAVTKDTEIRSFILSRSKFLESLCSPRNIRLVFRLGYDNITAPIDESLFEQVLTNIVKNSAESIGQDGTITISLEGRTLEITDNGHGISPEAGTETLLSVLLHKARRTRHRTDFRARCAAQTSFPLLPPHRPTGRTHSLHDTSLALSHATWYIITYHVVSQRINSNKTKGNTLHCKRLPLT